ncbi:MAG: hypothetical protein ABSE86_29700 [Bryobacteraceae bacterium]|jgi:predicted ester cyclase
MSEHNNKAIVRRIVEDHWNTKNPALVGELFAVNCSLHTPDGDLQGVKGAAETDRVAMRYSFAGTHKGALGAIPASGTESPCLES